ISCIRPATLSPSVSSSRPSLFLNLFILSFSRRGSFAHLTTSNGSFSPLSSQKRLQHFSFFSLTRYLILAASPFHLFTLSIITPSDCALSPTPPLLSLLTFLSCSVSSSSHHLLLLLQWVATLRWFFLNDTSFPYAVVPTNPGYHSFSSFSSVRPTASQSITFLSVLSPSPSPSTSVSPYTAQWSDISFSLSSPLHA